MKAKLKKGWLAHWKRGRFCLVITRYELWIGLCWDDDESVFYLSPFPTIVFGVKI